MISKVILRPILKWLIAVLTIFRNIRLSRCRILVDAQFVKIGIFLNNRDPETQKIAASESAAAKVVESQSWQWSP